MAGVRKRAHINLTTKLAAALACLLPKAERDAWRQDQMSPRCIIGLFQFDHIVLHAPPFIGSDEWWNLDPKPIGLHKEKSANDTRIVAKTKRLSAEHEDTRRRILAVKKRPKPRRRTRWPKRSLRR